MEENINPPNQKHRKLHFLTQYNSTTINNKSLKRNIFPSAWKCKQYYQK